MRLHFVISVAAAMSVTALTACPRGADKTAPESVAATPTANADQKAIDSARKISAMLDSIAVVERKVMMPMRDGIKLATDIYRPRNVSGKVPTIFVRSPYNFNYWDVQKGVIKDFTSIYKAVKRGYAYVYQNERGRYFSQGEWDILGPPLTDAGDAFSWIAKQSWSNGKIGLLGCSSTAEWQMAAASLGHPALAAMNPRGFGAGVGRVGRFYEQGNWYRGGAFQMLFLTWLYGVQNTQRPTFPANTSQEDLVRLSTYFDLAPKLPPVDWTQAIAHLPLQDIMRHVNGPKGIYADATPAGTGGRMIQRAPNDPAWYKGGLYHDNMPFKAPSLWFMSWYDVSVAPNIETFNHVVRTASPEIAKNQYAVIAPTLHCGYEGATADTKVGELSVGDARYDYEALTYGWFDHFLKGDNNGLLDTLSKVRYFTMGSNKWQTSETWPPKGATEMTYFLSSGGKANTGSGDGTLTTAAPASDAPDKFTYDPMNPVPLLGGNFCCMGSAFKSGSVDQRPLEKREDVLVYSSEPLKEGVEVSGPIEVTLYLSSDRKDTDLTVKLIDVYPDGRAFNLDETIQRVRYREGYTKTPVFMEAGKVYKVTLGPMVTSNFFAPGHRIRIHVSSSNFPRFDRNLNTGGDNYSEKSGMVAQNVIHHSTEYPSHVKLTVVKR
jgi:uncharacterized protein